MAETRHDYALRASVTAAAIAGRMTDATPTQRDLAARIGSVCAALSGLLHGADPDTQLRVLAATDALMDALDALTAGDG